VKSQSQSLMPPVVIYRWSELIRLCSAMFFRLE